MSRWELLCQKALGKDCWILEGTNLYSPVRVDKQSFLEEVREGLETEGGQAG